MLRGARLLVVKEGTGAVWKGMVPSALYKGFLPQ